MSLFSSNPARKRRRFWEAGMVALPLLGMGSLFLTTGLRPAQAEKAPLAPVTPGVTQPPGRPRPPRPPMPPPTPLNSVVVRSITVNTVVRDGVAETEVSHVFHNRSGRPQEGDF